MSLDPGTRLGPYEILGLAGAGGMGEVYKARDTRLDRTVAVKILPPHSAGYADLKLRFEREAQTIGSLKHPHICILHDIGRTRAEGAPTGQQRTATEVDFIVMEYLEGETLADRLLREQRRASGSAATGASAPGAGDGSGDSRARGDSAGPADTSAGRQARSGISGAARGLKIEDALSVAIQIADALDQAHRHGVVHRDLKPANVMLVSSGGTRSATPHVKLLDFGLAKLTTPGPPDGSALTVQADLTGPGMILGTMRYMAPEQVEGKEADARTDIFAFGAVLYEMLTGRKAFEGKSQPSLIAAIMSAEPASLSALLPMAPRALDRLVRRSLAKDPEERWQTAHDLLIQLKWIASGGQGAGPQAAFAAPSTRERLVLAALAVGVLATAAMAVPAFSYFQGPAPPEEFRFRIPAVGLSPSDMAISPDGENIAMVARPDEGQPALYVRPVAAVTFRRLAGTENAAQPFWSPDNKSIGFVAGGRLKKVAASGTPPQDIGAVEGFWGGTWNADGTILFGSPAGVRRISAEGGTAEAVTTVEKPETGHYWPYFLPDGQHFVYLAWSVEPGNRAIFAGSLGSKERTGLLAAESNPVYAASSASVGHLVFRREGTVLAQPFDAGNLTLSGEPVQIAGGVGFSPANGRGQFDVSQNGTLIFFQGTGGGAGRAQVNANWQFGWHDRAGKLLEVAGEPGSHGDMDLSADGKLIAVTRQDTGAAAADIWVIDWQRGVSTKLTLDPADDINPVWSPDGNRIAFTSFRKGNADVFVKNANGVGQETPLLDSADDEYIEDWSKDGRYVAYRLGQGEFDDLYVLPLDTDGKLGKPFPVVTGRFRKDEPQFSYDGKWLAYASDESGTFEIYVVSFPALDQKLKISDGGGGRPRWRQDGKELFYMRLVGGPMVVDFTPGPKIGAAVPRVLFATAALGATPTRHLWDVSPDGQRVLLRTFAGGGGQRRGGVLAPPLFTAQAARGAAPPAPRGRGGASLLLSSSASNALTVVRPWTAALEKAAK
jgi:serine/threonine protein kinase/Tol biopolymer transport system component